MVNPRPARSHTVTLARWMLALLALPAMFLLARPLAAQTPDCDRSGCEPIRVGSRVVCFTPATPVPPAFWGELQPTDTGALPASRDTTNFNENVETYWSRNWFFGLEIQNGYVLMGLAHGIGVWDARTDPANPAFVSSKLYAPGQSFPYIPAGESSKIVFTSMSAPDDTVAAVAGNFAGLLVFDLSNKGMPRAVYQNADRSSQSVWTTKIGTTRYAFMASLGGVYVYNLEQALASNGCLQNAANPNNCPGVLVKQIATPASGVILHGDGNFLVSSFGPSGGFQIYNVSDPLNPQLRLTGLRDATNRPVQGVALWHQGSSYYLAARLGLTLTIRQEETAIYDVSCIATSSCNGLGAPLWHQSLDTQSGNDLVTFSRSGTTPFLYVGGDAACLGSDGAQHEFLLDVTNPSSPRDITPTHVIPETANYNSVPTTIPVNYWSYYDRASPTGFNHVEPFAGKFNGQYFYRAARSIFDIHKWVHDVAPVADFTWSPAQIYPGTPVTFTDISANVPNSWTWTFQNGTPPSASGGAASSVLVSFGSTGSKSVTLTSQNSSGPSAPATKSIVVLSPAPSVGTVTVSPPSPSICQPVTFTATGVTGQSPLSYGWTVAPTPPGTAPTSSTASLVWSDTSQAASNVPYTATVTVSNSSGTATRSGSVTFAPLVPLSFTGANGAPETDPFTAATLQLHARTLGATSWSWDYGDGQGFRPYTNDPVTGPNPVFTYAAAGTYTVLVKIKNCVPNNGEITSAPLTVHVTQTTPLIASFQASVFCNLGICLGTTGQAISFADSSTGADHWDYDWTHSSSSAATCSFTDADHTAPVTSHTYTTNGTYYPCLRVRRGAEQNVAVHVGISVSGGGGGGGNPAITIGGNSAGSINQAYTFTASAINCTPSSTGWTWALGGGGTGSSTGSSISVTWATTGSKTVSATNSACSGATGLRSVNITDPNTGGGGGLAAKFTFSPASPKPGDTVSFDGSTSTGSPTSYIWSFGDGTQASTAMTTHAYAAAGSYLVQLAVGAPGTGCPVAPCIVQSTTTQTVVVQGPPPVVADYTTTGATCAQVGGFDFCAAQTLQAVTLTATATDGASYQWSFGDSTTGTGASVSHAWSQAGSFQVTLTVTKGASSASKSRTFTVTGTTPPPPPPVKEVVLPWIAQTRGALVQSSDLYVHNPSTSPMTVTLEFRKRGTPDVNPPQVSKTVAPGATLYVADVLRELFNRENIAGFVSLTVTQGDMAPVITSYNTTVQADGKQFGQTISGISMTPSGSAVGAATGTSQNLVGLISNADRLAYFGVSNPGSTAATYHLRFFDKLGALIGESSQDFTVSPFGQRQFQAGEIQSTFGISNQADYRVEVSTTTGGASLLPYASNLRLSSQDPSFIEAGSAKSSKAYLLGVLSAAGNNNSLWRSDLLLSNIGTQMQTADVTFTSVGLSAVPTNPVHLALLPGQTQRLENVVAGQLGVQNGIGVLTVSSASPEGIFPIVQGESYDTADPTKRFGQSMAALTDANAAGSGQSQYLAGLRQDANHRTTFWLFNPGAVNAQYDILYRGLDGSVIGSTRGVILGAGKLRQFSPSQHPIPATGVQDGFTVQIVVTSGKVLSAAQVVNNDTNDPSYIQGEAR